ncbi:hypothetical protein N9053_01290 [bacterium]|nr:hypothetical protein [bacterium]
MPRAKCRVINASYPMPRIQCLVSNASYPMSHDERKSDDIRSSAVSYTTSLLKPANDQHGIQCNPCGEFELNTYRSDVSARQQ